MGREFGFTPEQVGNMTLGEIAALMEDPESVNGGQTDAELDAYMKWWGALTPAERLANAERWW